MWHFRPVRPCSGTTHMTTLTKYLYQGLSLTVVLQQEVSHYKFARAKRYSRVGYPCRRVSKGSHKALWGSPQPHLTFCCTGLAASPAVGIKGTAGILSTQQRRRARTQRPESMVLRPLSSQTSKPAHLQAEVGRCLPLLPHPPVGDGDMFPNLLYMFQKSCRLAWFTTFEICCR